MLQLHSSQQVDSQPMVGKKRKSSSRTALGNHQKSWIWGRHVVLETLRAGRWHPFEVVCSPELLSTADLREVQQRCTTLALNSRTLSGAELERLVHARDHQGIAARMPAFPLTPLEILLTKLPQHPFLLILDRIQDPFNFGSILRSADQFGVDGILVGEREQATVSSHVVRSSVGAVNYLEIVQSSSLTTTARTLREQGWKLIAATEKATQAPDALDLTTGVVFIMGNEGAGIDASLLELCTHQAAIPQQGHVDSLNAAVAAGIFCYEVQRQRRITT